MTLIIFPRIESLHQTRGDSTHPDPRLLDEPLADLGIVERQAVRRGVFKSVKDLNAKIRAFIDGWHDRAHPFVWTKTAEQVLTKANRPTISKTNH